MLPEKTQASLTKGLLFVHKDGINIIKIFGSVSGNEKVYLNDELVLEHRSLKTYSEHQFNDAKGDSYVVKFHATKLLKGEMDFLIFKNDNPIKKIHTTLKKPNNKLLLRLLFLVGLTIVYTYIKIILNLPEYTFIIYFILILILHFSTIKHPEIIISEE